MRLVLSFYRTSLVLHEIYGTLPTELGLLTGLNMINLSKFEKRKPCDCLVFPRRSQTNALVIVSCRLEQPDRNTTFRAAKYA